MFRPKINGSSFDVRDYDLPNDQVDWLEQVLPKEPTLRDLDLALSKPAYTRDQKRILEALRESVCGPLRLAPGVVFTKDGPQDVEKTSKVWNLRGAKVAAKPGLAGKSATADEFREALAPYLVGQEAALPEFYKMAKAFDSPTQLISPVMVLGGPKSHGKEQALEGFAKAFFGEHASVISVDLSRVKDEDVDHYFEEGGASGELSAWALQEVEDRKKGVVHLTGLDDIITRAPAFAERLFKLLSAQRDDQGYARVHFFVDFDFRLDDEKVDTNVLSLLKKALGASSRYLPCAKATFQMLEAEAMLKYAAGAFAELQTKPGLGQLRIEFDEDAKTVLGRVLATPFQPLEEVKSRIRSLIFAQLEARDDVPADAVIRVHLSPHLAADSALLERRIADMHAEDADTINVDDIFLVREEARLADDEARAELLEQGRQLVDTTEQLVAQLSTHQEKFAPEYELTEKLLERLTTTAELLSSASQALQGSKRVRTTPDAIGKELSTIAAETEDLLKQLGSTGTTRLRALGIELDVKVARAMKTSLETTRLTSHGLRNKNGSEAVEESVQRFATNAMSLSAQITECRDQLGRANADMLESSLLTRFHRLARTIEQAIDVSEQRTKEDVFPLLMKSEAEALLAAIGAVRTAVAEAKNKSGPSATLLAAMNAAGAKNVLPAILDRAERIATALGGLGKEDRVTIGELYARESADSQKLRRDLARRLIRTENGATDDDARVAMAQLIKLPLRVLKRLDRNKIPVVVIRGKMTDYLRMDDKEKKTRPPGYPEGKTYDDIPAIFSTRTVDGKETAEVIIVTGERGGRRVIPGLDEKRGDNSVIHEVMHAFDKNGAFSQTPEFLALAEEERAALTPYEKQPVETAGGSTFDRGAAEAWAITGERLYGGDDTVRAERPKLTAYLEKMTKDDEQLEDDEEQVDA